MLNYSKTYIISLINQDLWFLAVTSQAPFPALSVNKSEGESSFMIGSIYAFEFHRALTLTLKSMGCINLFAATPVPPMPGGGGATWILYARMCVLKV